MYSVKRANRYLLFTILSYIAGSLLLSVAYLYSQNTPGIITQVILSQYGMVALPILLYFIVTKSPLVETLLIRKIKPLNVLLCVILAFTISPTLSLFNIFSQFFVENNVSDMVLELANAPYGVALFLVAMTPAVFEEIAMRSIIINNYRGKTVLTTCLISGFFFGMFHMNLNQFSYAFVMGVVMCLAVHLTGSVLASMTIHFVINGTSVTLAKMVVWAQEFFAKTDPELVKQLSMTTIDDASLMSSFLVLLVINLFSLPLTGVVLWGLAKYNDKLGILKAGVTSGEVLGLRSHPMDGYGQDPFEALMPVRRETVLTPSLICAIGLFSIFVLTFEVVIPMMG